MVEVEIEIKRLARLYVAFQKKDITIRTARMTGSWLVALREFSATAYTYTYININIYPKYTFLTAALLQD